MTDTVDPASLIYSIMCLLMLLFLYLLPSFIAARRNHHNGGAIFVLNLLMGWTVLGWVLSLVWACTALMNTREAA